MNSLFDNVEIIPVSIENVKTRKDFINLTSCDLTDEESEVWVSRFGMDSGIRVKNTWHTLMGRIGSTSISIVNKNGKERPFGDHPDWRPLAVCDLYFTTYFYGNGSESHHLRLIAQSWDDIRKNCSQTEDMTWYVFKHPHQY